MTELIPRAWAEKPLAEVAEVIQGQSPPGSTYNTSGEGLPFFQGKAEFGDLYPSPRKWCTNPRKVAEQGDVLLSIRAPVGPTNLAQERCCIGRGLAAIRPRDGISTKYLLYFLRSVESELAKKATGTTFGAIGGNVLRAQRVRLAPPQEQDAIVSALDSYFSRLDEVEAGLERVQRNLKRYRASVLQAAVTGRLVPTEADLARAEGREYEPASSLLGRWQFPSSRSGRKGRFWGAGAPPRLTPEEEANIPEGWCWTKVRSLGVEPGTAVQVGPLSMRSEDFAESGVPVFTVGSVQWASFDEARLRYLPENAASSFQRYRILPGDVLFTRSGTIGRSAVASSRHAHFLMTFHLLRVRPDIRKCNPHYLQMVFEGASHLRRQAQGGAIGSTRAGFNTNLLGELDVPLPPRPEQERIVAQAEALISDGAAVEAIMRSSRVRINQLRQATLNAAFAGVLAGVGAACSEEPRERVSALRLNSPHVRS